MRRDRKGGDNLTGWLDIVLHSHVLISPCFRFVRADFTEKMGGEGNGLYCLCCAGLPVQLPVALPSHRRARRISF